MSTNVDHVECLSGELTITEEGKKWLAQFENNEIEVDHWPECLPEIKTKDGREIVDMNWSGEGSGRAVDVELKQFFALTRGTAEFVFYWEGGYFATGYRVVDGVTTEHKVEVKLGEPLNT